ncbi:MAG: efflux RND transporter periplasmic adaptor subunit [Planctomicrobium sp.]|nr:efflux RND transporter periplasmic adaptor subunit [Planctomicrobium sp.]
MNDVLLWQIDLNQVIPLWQSRQNEKSFSIDKESLSHIEVGEIQAFDSPSTGDQTEPHRLSLTSVPIVDSARMVIAFQHSPSQQVDDDLFQIGEILADIRRRELLQKLYASNQKQNRIFHFLAELHNSTSQEELIQLFVTDGVTVSMFERISVLSRKANSGWAMAACTGVDSVSDRSEEVQRICTEVIHAEKVNDLAGPIMPLSPDGEWSSAKYAVVLEKQGDIGSTDLQVGKLLSSQMAMAFAHIADRNLSKRKKRKNQRINKPSFWIVLFLVAGCSLMFFWQMEFRIKATGIAVPQQRQEIFAPNKGLIQVVNVQHGEHVEEGDILFEIYNDELLVLRESTREEFVAASARLAALRTISQRNGSVSQPTSGSLPPSVELAELEKKIESLTTQVELIDEQLSSLKVVAPFAGQVFRERMQEELLGRPIQQGQYVLQIAALNGPWELRLRIPENEIRHVTSAQANQQAPLPLTFALETSPELERSSSVTQLSKTTDLDSYGKLSTLALSNVKKEEIPDARFGAGVFAKVRCGTRSLGYLMTRRVSEFWVKYSPF